MFHGLFHMDVRLIMQPQGASHPREVRLRSVETTIGRQRGCGLRLVSSDISRLHCRIAIQNDQITVRDLGSVNGTYVNGYRIRGEQTLQHGDQLAVGPALFTVQVAGAPLDQAVVAVPLDDTDVEQDLVEPELVEPEVVDQGPDEAGAFVFQNLDEPQHVVVEPIVEPFEPIVEPIVEPEPVAYESPVESVVEVEPVEVEPVMEVEPVEVQPVAEVEHVFEVEVLDEEPTAPTGSLPQAPGESLPTAEVEESQVKPTQKPSDSLPYAEVEEINEHEDEDPWGEHPT